MQKERIPWLVQYGPRSLNFVRKKTEGRKIMQENLLLKERIERAKSSVRIDEMLRHQEKIDGHKRILMESSPSRAALDPLVQKHLKKQSVKEAASLLGRSPTRHSSIMSSIAESSKGGEIEESWKQRPSRRNLSLEKGFTTKQVRVISINALGDLPSSSQRCLRQ